MVRACGSRDPEQLAEYLGVAIYAVDNFKDLKGMYAWIDGRACIFVNSRLPERLQQLVLAHELGHHVLHRELAEKAKVWQDLALWDPRSKAEYEANLFAADFLLEDTAFLAKAEEGLSLDQLAAEFGYVREFIIFKAKSLIARGARLQLAESIRSDFLG